MAYTETTKHAITQIAVETAKTTELSINGENRRQSINANHSGAAMTKGTEQYPP